MNDNDAVNALSALAHPLRLRVFRMLVAAAPEGVPAGNIAENLGVAASSLSFHLSQLQQAGLVTATRQQRFILYATDIGATRGLIEFLTADCCGGRPELCGQPGLKPTCNTSNGSVRP
ncbi:MAG: helix-turn-helix domain-containing protein [Gammaproteobacteria bacterium]